MNISDWIEFDITEADIRRAEKLAKEIRKEARKQKRQPRFQTNALENEIVGLLGEGKFEEWLKYLKIPYERDTQIGRGDKFDFEIYGKIYSVKTNVNDWHPSRSPYNYKFLVNKSQFDTRKDVAHYVSMMIYKFEKAWFCGLISRTEVSKDDPINPGYAICYGILYSDLQKPQKLREIVLETPESRAMR